MNHYLIDDYAGALAYNGSIRQANPKLETLVNKAYLTSWCAKTWVHMYQLALL